MQPTRRGALGLIGSAGLVPSAAAAVSRLIQAHAMADDLRVEWLSSPSGIDTLRPRFTWILQSGGKKARDVQQTACRIVVASSRRKAQSGVGDIWDSGKQNSSAFRLAPSADLPLHAHLTYWWSIMLWDGDGRASRWCTPARFLTGMLSGWQAQWIAAEPDRPPMPLPPNALAPVKSVPPKPMPVFRRDFSLDKAVTSAVVSVSGLGHYELAVNGKAVTSSVLNPGWTNYRKSVFYNTFDVTSLLHRGRNALALLLGNGMYNVESYPGRYTKFSGSFGQPKLILQLTITYADGSQIVIASDEAWQTRSGPITLSSAYAEDFDARKLAPDWMTALPQEGWNKVLTVAGPGGALKAQNIPPVTEAKRFKPVRITEPKPGIFVYDFGQNMSGWPNLLVSGSVGSTVKLMTAELLAEDGLVDPASAGGRPGLEHYYSYTLCGRGKEAWHPRFSYYGFRYLQVEGATPPNAAKAGVPVLHELEASFLYTDLRATGRFESSNRLFDRIHRLIKLALLSNTFSVLTDCPHREKLGWLEQTYLNADTVFCNEDGITLYEKLAHDIVEAQASDGMVPGIAPEYIAFFNTDGSNAIWRDSPEWGAAAVLSPLAACRYYGDPQVLETAYPAMKRYADYLASRAKDGLIGFGMGDWYDLGSAAPGPAQLTSLTLASMCSYYAVLDGIAEAARLTGREDEHREYLRRAEALKSTFNQKLFNPQSGGYDSNSQTANAMPLVLGMVPQEHQQGVLDNLVSDIRKRDNHISAGDIGFHYVLLALMQNGHAELLREILSKTDAPSYGYQLAQGATTLTEAWNTNRPNSQNHFMLGHAETWFYRGLGGINLDMSKDGAQRLRIEPQTVSGIDGCSIRYRSVLGEVISHWHRKNGVLELFVGIPAGAEATIVLPWAAERKNVTVGSGDHVFKED